MKTRWPHPLALAMALAFASGCAPSVGAAGGHREHGSIGEEGPVAAPRPAAGRIRGWVMLGAVMADGRQDRDTLSLPPERERHYRSLGLRIFDSRIAIDDIVVEFEDGSRESLHPPRIFEEGETREIALPADERRVRAVHFRYSELRRGGPGATLEIWAR